MFGPLGSCSLRYTVTTVDTFLLPIPRPRCSLLVLSLLYPALGADKAGSRRPDLPPYSRSLGKTRKEHVEAFGGGQSAANQQSTCDPGDGDGDGETYIDVEI